MNEQGEKIEMTQLEIIKQNYTLLPVIASFDAEGHAKPLFIRVGGESYKIFSCQLKKILKKGYRNPTGFKLALDGGLR